MADFPARAGRRVTFKGRQRGEQSVQTESSFVPDCKDLGFAYDPLASEQYENLIGLRQMIQTCIKKVAGDVYDVVNFKDILFQLESELPSSLPVTDLLLLSSRLFRRTAELGRLLSCFFGVVFADDYNDEHFRFTEVRLLQREVRELKRQLEGSEKERVRLQQKLDNVGQIAYDHGKAVEALETHNEALKKQTTALEDQMALLFHQLNAGLESHCKDAYKQVSGETKVQESLNPTRITFRQTMDSLSEQLRGSRGLITEVREVLLSCSSGGRTGEAYVAVEPSVRFKLKMLDSNFQQLMGRFTAIKDTVVETAQELMTALQERKKILYLSFQHIRLYDLQNAKMRNARAILSQLQQNTTEVVQRIQVTFPGGALTSVDRFGNIASQRWQGGYTLATLRGYKLAQKNEAAERVSLANSVSGEVSTSAPPRHSLQPGRLLPGLTEAQVMAAESELAALEGRPFDATAGLRSPGNAPFTGNGEGSPPSASMQLQSCSTSQSISAAGGFSQGTPANAFSNDDSDVAPFASIGSFLDIIRQVNNDMEELQKTLVLDDEMAAFLKMLTLSASTTPRTDVGDNTTLTGGRASQLERQEYNMEAALHPTGSGLDGNRSSGNASKLSGALTEASNRGENDSFGSTSFTLRSPRSPDSHGSASSRADRGQSDAALARQAVQLQRQQEQITKMQEDFSSKIGFLRQIYEARIGDLEVRESNVSKRYANHGAVTVFHTSRATDDSIATATSMKPSSSEGRPAQPANRDKEQLMRMRKNWQQTKFKLQPNRRLREATVNELENSGADDEEIYQD
ncbi:hypothetical protein ABB37_01168 [Leptomonas pyrrhocoris]|uniref:Uncharacterized protein n=1 Tax=Leptomonas pyrrhocoris TaxID=157538 RepID=A0A0N0VGY4_LEPPY|nr:hypothetical protein ABB37_01168 [Leptomonas pyrrhocoris]KPA84654.1 hypothetical protein ABB37_01168 [Leptomonas pyrrhocoris]|eukprot:XP_015663093.1 hypothetical protein ABB37_01168 [Leptomonas pyrrhocoris]